LLSACNPDAISSFCHDLSTAQEAVQRGVATGRNASSHTHWRSWCHYTATLGVDPFLQTIQDKIPILQVFLLRVRQGALARNRGPVLARTAEDYLRSVGQTFQLLGYPDPRLNSLSKVDYRLNRMLASFKKQDPPPNRVKPVPIQVLRHIATRACTWEDPVDLATADMIILAFFFLLRPGEYTANRSDTSPFRFQDVQLFIGPTRLDLNTATPELIRQATFATPTFTTQKNGVCNEVIGHARSGDLYLCPVHALIRRVLHLRAHNAARETPLATAYHHESPVAILPAHITQTLRQAVLLLGPSLGFLPSDVSARCLRAAGATALLCANVDSCHIELLGRWHSDQMLRYLHLQAQPLMRQFSQKMLHGGQFSLIPNHLVPSF